MINSLMDLQPDGIGRWQKPEGAANDLVKQDIESMPLKGMLCPAPPLFPGSPEGGNVTLPCIFKSKTYFLMLLYHLSPHYCLFITRLEAA